MNEEDVVHRIWISPDGAPGMPSDFRAYGQRWEELNPGWRVCDWPLEELQRLPFSGDLDKVVADLVSRSPCGMTESLACQLADVFSYSLLSLYGGIYVNCDIDPVRPIWVLPVQATHAWACWENPEVLVNAAMGGPRGHPFWQACCEALPSRYFSMPGAEMNQATGPHLLTSVYRSYSRRDFTDLPRDTFNPYMWNDIPVHGQLTEDYTLESLPPRTVGVHHWAHRRTMRSNVVEEGVPYAQR